ncbi:hypothetical protein VP01_3637g2 [Puccinia sorghi]|uniref:Uncharacterized protein n=1 Tax=Puccinia sorghi TaxID=27349 RepID=A0A0L6UUN6_9BASI|nr:hypothetical protein VP01_3637g2 [Puccinia sorghi]
MLYLKSSYGWKGVGNNPYVCVCQHYSCNLSKHEVKGIGTVCGRVLLQQVYQEHQRKETQRIANKKLEPFNQKAEEGRHINVSSGIKCDMLCVCGG